MEENKTIRELMDMATKARNTDNIQGQKDILIEMKKKISDANG